MLTVNKRDDKVFTFHFYDEDGDAIDLTDAALYTTVKQNLTDADAAAKIATALVVTAPATNGIATWTLLPASTQYMEGLYFWDVQMVSATGVVTTLIRDVFEVLPDVTIRVSA